MTEQSPAAPATRPAPPIEVDFPNIDRWEAGNSGIPFLWTFNGARDGPHLALQALTHGNEVCGAIALDFLLAQGLRPERGKLSFCFANAAAYRNWNPAEPFKSRFVDEDYNRLWTPAVLDSDRTSTELMRARELRNVYDTVD